MKQPPHTHYDNLKVPPDATDEDIRTAYRRLCRQYHPDCKPATPDAERIIRLINQAYAVLSNPESRRAHDKWIAEQQTVLREERIGSPMPKDYRTPEADISLKIILAITAAVLLLIMASTYWNGL
ncbi:MAG: J domain-containing protein [Neisseria sp.]|nr:J domain-containing protein [Neisseria sp.]